MIILCESTVTLRWYLIPNPSKKSDAHHSFCNVKSSIFTLFCDKYDFLKEWLLNILPKSILNLIKIVRMLYIVSKMADVTVKNQFWFDLWHSFMQHCIFSPFCWTEIRRPFWRIDSFFMRLIYVKATLRRKAMNKGCYEGLQ